MPTRTHYLTLPFHKSEDGAGAILDHLIECASEAEAISRAEQLATYPEYVGAIAVAMRRRDGAPYGNLVLTASFGIFRDDLASIFKSLNQSF